MAWDKDGADGHLSSQADSLQAHTLQTHHTQTHDLPDGDGVGQGWDEERVAQGQGDAPQDGEGDGDAPARIEPRAHQIEALDALRDALARGTRAQAHMCCGSGKTFTQAFLARYVIESLEDPSGAVLVCFVPNRALIHQNARNFRKVFGPSVAYLGVCSEADLAGLVMGLDQEEGLETTTDPESIAAFLAGHDRPRILVSTYQSAPTLRAAMAAARGQGAAIDLGLFDEAHRTAGDKTEDSLFAFALDDARFPMAKRGFFTATPRITQGSKAAAMSMSNPDLYGPIAYTYPFSRGIADGNVVDYDLWVPIITRAELAAFMRDQGLDGEERTAVAMIALEKVMEKTGQSRFLTYHHRISASQAFAERLSAKLGPTGTFVAHVDGSTPGVERERLMAALNEGKTILTNCKAFVEGVDAPGVQGALFVDPRKSVVEVVQAVGRLSRPDPRDPHKRGSIIAPILAEAAEPSAIARAAKTSGFDTLIQVAEALRANDDALEEDILERSRAVGRGDAEVATLRHLEVIAPDDCGFDIETLAQAITVATMDALRDTFAEQVGRLERHLADHGHLPTAQTDPRLASWVANVRKKHATAALEPVHAALLDTIDGWSWVGERSRADTIAAHIAAFRDRTQRMPSGKRGGHAEADLHAHLMEAQETFLRQPAARWDPLTATLHAANLLFFTEEVLGKRAQVSGRFAFVPDPQGGHPKVFFHPRADAHRQTVPFFRSGHSIPPRPIRVHVGRAERERLLALPPRHSARVTLVRAGISDDPYDDGRIFDWHAGVCDRGETPATSKRSLTWLLARLYDRKVSGRTPYSRAALHTGLIKGKQAATVLFGEAPTGTTEEVLDLIDRARTAAQEGRLDDARARALDAAPGFSWIEVPPDPADVPKSRQRVPFPVPERATIATVTAALVARHGPDVLASHEARLPDTGLAHTLRALDALRAHT